MKIIFTKQEKQEVINYITSNIEIAGETPRLPTAAEVCAKYHLSYRQYRNLVIHYTDLPRPESLSSIRLKEIQAKRLVRQEKKLLKQKQEEAAKAKCIELEKQLQERSKNVLLAVGQADQFDTETRQKAWEIKKLKKQIKEQKEEKRRLKKLKTAQELPQKRKEYAKRYREKQAQKPLARLRSNLKSFQSKSECPSPFTAEDVVAKFGPNPVCYLTGLPIDYEDTATYQLDHFIPLVLGGKSDLDNLRLCHPTANQMKNRFDFNHFIYFCRLIAKNNPPKESEIEWV